MDYRNLGRSGLRVSPLCLGTMNFGGPHGCRHRRAHRGPGAGCRGDFVDTADAYTGGESERILGGAIRADRDRWVLATKLANPVGEGPNGGGTSRKWIMRAAEGSLERLGTDFIDIYYLHKEDHATPLAETVRAMGDLVRAGKIRYFGVSNYRSWRVAEICALCDAMGIDRPVVSQPYYHALNRTPETEHLPACGFYGLGVVSYSPLARGVLTAKYDPDAPPPADNPRRAGRQADAANGMAAGVAAPGAADCPPRRSRRHHRHPLRGRLGAEQPLGHRGDRRPPHRSAMDDYLAALDYRFTAADEALIDGLVAPGHASTPGYNDPAYPIEGRPTRT